MSKIVNLAIVRPMGPNVVSSSPIKAEKQSINPAADAKELAVAVTQSVLKRSLDPALFKVLERVLPHISTSSAMAWDALGPQYGMQPIDAADCFKDDLRTRDYLLAIAAHLAELRQRFPHEQLRVLDVGTGPYALLALFATALDPNLIVEAVECTESSVWHARATIARLGLSERISVIHADFLTQPQSASSRPQYHLAMTETFCAGMTHERGDLILQRMQPLVLQGGVLLPESMTLEARLESDQNPRLHSSRWQPLMHSPVNSVANNDGMVIIAEGLEPGLYLLELRTRLTLTSQLIITRKEWPDSPITEITIRGLVEIPSKQTVFSVAFQEGRVTPSIPFIEIR